MQFLSFEGKFIFSYDFLKLPYLHMSYVPISYLHILSDSFLFFPIVVSGLCGFVPIAPFVAPLTEHSRLLYIYTYIYMDTSELQKMKC